MANLRRLKGKGRGATLPTSLKCGRKKRRGGTSSGNDKPLKVIIEAKLEEV